MAGKRLTKSTGHARFWARVGRACSAGAVGKITSGIGRQFHGLLARSYGANPGYDVNAGKRLRWARLGRRCDPPAWRKHFAAIKAGRLSPYSSKVIGYGGPTKGKRVVKRDARGRFVASRNPFGYSLERVPVVGRYLDDATQHLSVANARDGAGIVGGAAATYLVTKYAVPKAIAAWNQGWWGVGLTAIAGGLATLGASVALPALAVPVGLGAFLASVVRALIVGAPAVVDRAVQPLLEWKAVEASAPAPAPAGGAGAGYPAVGGRVAGLLAGRYVDKPAFSGLGEFEARGDKDGF